ncbi:thiamine pyrophosphate-dependent dehydrogenase E1 component subunit alpha [Siminovitchia terrae]|uniref:thiamine pyrophosphate-dependent dehydrogenase E1 component subunit alpha n=1 Tax=Siminovitchia terrae TaxID=1914933 RepID=UPI001B0D7AB0|nr:thiamine pyrophosphate-dependent dehydrogenase E1 component subunit alpha [Siminovitchia terrae]GIN93432.1 pyruvate dehydrogenase E1 component subunit alpha [Siminovitchia terrae]
MTVPLDKLKWMYEMMTKSRYYEDQMTEVYLEGKTPVFNIGAGTVPGEMHLSTGQEPAAVICAHLTKDDTVTSPHRPHHHAIAKGVDLKRMTAEIFGKETGFSKGKGGHMHLFDPDVKFSCSGIVGAGIPQAAGAALAAKMKGKDWVAVTFLGEGAANSGAFHETLNMAALWKLPLILVIEDNAYGISVSKKASTAIESNDLRASAYGIEGAYVKNNDPIEMYKISEAAIKRARNGEGPSIIEIETFRYQGHFQGDPELYREKEEVPSLKERDPILRIRKLLIDDYGVNVSEVEEIESKVKAEVDEAYNFARESELPKPEAALADMFN